MSSRPGRMTLYEHYCAICGGPLRSSSVRIGRRPRAAATSEAGSDDDMGEFMDSDDDEDTTYDPQFVTQSNIQWMNKFYCLGCNDDAEGSTKSFLTGPCRYDEDEEIIAEQGHDANQPNSERISCYRDDLSSGLKMSFPFHDACYILLLQLLPETTHTTVDRDALYVAMKNLIDSYSTLDLNYGITIVDMFWESLRGEQMVAFDPVCKAPEFEDRLWEQLTKTRDSGTSILHSTAASHLGVNDLMRLPTEILLSIGLLIPIESIGNFAVLSKSCLRVVESELFWRNYLRTHFPWAWEVDELRSTRSHSGQLHFKAACLWLNEVSKPSREEHLGIVNRRRVWGVCEQIANEYWKQLTPSTVRGGESFNDSIQCHFMARLDSTDHHEVSTERLLWVHDKKSFEGGVTTSVEGFWDRHGALVGLGTTTGQRRHFAGLHPTELSRRIADARFKAGSWMRAIVVSVCPLRNIRGITFMAEKSHQSVTLGEKLMDLDRLVLVPEELHQIVGLEVEKVGDRIAGIGLLQYSPDTSALSSTKRIGRPIFWSRRTSEIDGLYYVPEEIRETELVTLTTESASKSSNGTIGAPTEILLWNSDAKELNALQKISLYVPEKDGHRVLAGIRANFARGHSVRKKVVGRCELNIWGAPMDEVWPDEAMVSLKIDGKGGERITQIAVSDTGIAGIKLTTSLGRELTSGNQDEQWKFFEVKEGEEIAGLCVAFAPEENKSESLCSWTGVTRGRIVLGLEDRPESS